MTPRSDSRPSLVVSLALVLAMIPILCAAPAGAQRIAFVTSTTGTGDLGSWPGAGGQTGVAAGDEICRTRAGAAGLANPAEFVAWISDSSDDAYCRVHGLTGTVASNCGQGSLPAAAGPWWRRDGMPFADVIGALTSAQVVFLPALLDELGTEIPNDMTAAVYTATFLNGTLYPSDGACSDWLSAAPAEITATGKPHNTSSGWTVAGSTSCATPLRLLCLEKVAGAPLPTPAPSLRRAFLSSASGTGDLASWPQADPGATGLAAGDSICRNLAQAAGFAESATFKAWLSDTANDAADRFVHDGPWATPNGIVLAESRADLTDGQLRSSIHVTEQGAYLGNYGVWTGTGDDGLRKPERCLDWTSSSGGDTGAAGASDRTVLGWSYSFGATACDATYLQLYCLSDAEGPFFADGFEWATTAGWSSVEPGP